MKYSVGDRVRCIKSFLGVTEGEIGTIQHIHGNGTGFCDITIRWDLYNRNRHDNDGKCEIGHGYMLSATDIEPAFTPVDDLGELPSVDKYDTELLFGM